MASLLAGASTLVPEGTAETPTRRLSLPIPKRRSPPSRNTPLHQMYDGVYGQSAGLQVQARKYFCAVSPSHSSDASTIDDCEEAPAMRGPNDCQLGPTQYVPDIMCLYSLGQLIGTGSQSFVYQCHWTERAPSPSDGPLCIKHIVGDSSREALTAACKVQHPNVARHFATYDDWRGLWVLMEYIRGPDLAGYLNRVGRLSEATCKHIFRQIMCALECIHAHNLVHQDVKLENIVVREKSKQESTSQERSSSNAPQEREQDIPDVEIALVDFGSAEVVTSHQLITSKPEFSPAGTAMYMAPEAFLESPVDCKSDIWSAGILLCLLLSGCPPFEGQSIMHTLGQTGTVLTNVSARSERSQAAAIPSMRLSESTEGCRERKRRPLQQQEHSVIISSEMGRFNPSSPAGKAPDASAPPAGPEAVRDRLMEAFARPEWQDVSADAKELISEMLTVNTSSRPTAEKVMQSTWLRSS